MAISTVNGLTAALPSAQKLIINKATIANQGAGGWTSLWRATGFPAQAAVPAGAATCTSATIGAWPFANPAGGLTSYLSNLSISAATPHLLVIMDRLQEMGGLSGATTGDQTINVAIPASRGAVAGDPDLQWFCEIFTDIGTSAQASTITYTDPTDASRTITYSIGGSSPLNRAGRIFPLTPNAGQPFKTLTKINFGTTTGAAGSFGFFCAKILAVVDMGQPYVGKTFDWASLGFPSVVNDACIAFAVVSSTTSSGIITGQLKMVQG